MEHIQEKTPRAAVYIDGFNLYYPVREYAEAHLKWCDFAGLFEGICAEQKHALVKTVFCTAIQSHNPDAAARHRQLNDAQRARGVHVVEGHYVFDEERQKHTEKQSDINVALSLIIDAIDNVFDCAYLVSADSDQAATARVFKERFPEKILVCVAPPNRKPPQKSLHYADKTIILQKSHIEDNLLPQYLKNGGTYVRRPREYDPPQGWLAPKDRPKRTRP